MPAGLVGPDGFRLNLAGEAAQGYRCNSQETI